MASAAITFKTDNTKEVKSAPVGFSWTVLFYGLFAMLWRSDWKWASIFFVIGFLVWGSVRQFTPTPEASVFWVNVIFGFIYNKLYIKDLISKGYRAVSVNKVFGGGPIGELDDVIAKSGIDIPTQSDGETQSDNGSISEQEKELQRIEDMYERSLINDDERKAMRAKVLGLE